MLKIVGTVFIVLSIVMLGYLRLDHMANRLGREEVQVGELYSFVFNSTHFFQSPDNKLCLDFCFLSLVSHHFQMTEMLNRYYSAVNPEKIPDIEKTVRKYLGRQDTLHKRLKKRYGVDPRDY